MINRGVAIVHYNRVDLLPKLMASVHDTVPPNTKLVICDDGSTEQLPLDEITRNGFILVRGQNGGVAANKNRALWALHDCQYLAILEDDLFPIAKGWFEIYEEVSRLTLNHHFCRVQDKEINDPHPTFSEHLKRRGYNAIFGPSPRGDFTFITGRVLRKVGGFNPRFRGAGYAHSEWSNRVKNAELISHPLAWWDVKEARDKFTQEGDTEGGRWNISKKELEAQLAKNKTILRGLQKSNYIHHPLTLS